VPRAAGGCNDFERIFLGDLELTAHALQRVLRKSPNPKLSTRTFLAQAHLLTAGLLGQLPALRQTLQQLHDRCGQA
jgi:hypothetical protein